MNEFSNFFARCLVATGLLWAAVLHAASSEVFLFNGHDLSAWRATGEWAVAKAVAISPTDPTQFVVDPGEGLFFNGPKGRTINLLSKEEFGDVEVHVEFCLPNKSNSGVYLMGRYEVQVYDSFGVVKDKYPGLECGGLYPRWTAERSEFEGHSPRVNVSKKAGEWQSFDIVFRAPRFDASGKKTENARFLKVTHNGAVIHENIDITGPTRAAAFEDEKTKGPIMLQGDHGPIAYRNLRVTPVQLK